MAYSASPPTLLFSLFLLFLLTPPFSDAALHRARLSTSEDPPPAVLLRPSSTSQPSPAPPTAPTTFFQVTRPIPLPKTAPCSLLLLQHDFASTYTKPPVTAPYAPPPHCPRGRPPARVVLEWRAACRGRQFDRIFGVWLGGVELLRSCTAEPRATGIVWTVEKDVTRYSSLFAQNHTLSVFLGNIVDHTYTGVYHVNLTLHFYFSSKGSGSHGWPGRQPGLASPADLILPISRDLPLEDGQWFPIENSTGAPPKELAIPRNAYRAVLEVYVSFHSGDEFWYGNPPNDYIAANNLTGTPGNGPFREVVAMVDGDVVGAVWPFTVIYTGGVNPLLWRPITGIGSFDLPSYDIEITPFLGKLLDGKPHKFGFLVTNALSVWYVDANLHLWLDSKSWQTSGSLIKYEAPQFKPSQVSKFKGLDGHFVTTASRRISSTGWVLSSHGKLTTHFFQEFGYKNLMEFRGNGKIQVINQTINSTSLVYAKNPGSIVYSEEVIQNFPLYLYTATANQTNKSYSFIANVSLGFNEKRFNGEKFGFSVSSLTNSQKGVGDTVVQGSLVVSGIGSIQQMYTYESTEGCYFRNVSSSNYAILFDESGKVCSKWSPSELGYSFNRSIPYPVRRASLASNLQNQKNRDKNS
uniref:Peptide-N4-(N-acetyl-beta-glucosaminyl)asparagine amidase A n=1 Tax=Anthurium amnicola TaxID=1678845 RepID=A0A1D1Y319_9ARAE